MDAWGVGWARKDGKITAAFAPGHDRPRCVYVDFLNTGPAVSKTLRTRRAQDQGHHARRRPLRGRSAEGRRRGRRARSPGIVGSGAPVVISAKATIVATGGLTRLYRRNSASTNMGGDGYALCLRAGAPLIDMEFVQFFPIGHLAPRLIGMDPIMWDPFRYKLGGRLLNNDMARSSPQRYGVPEDGKYVITRDVGTYAILKEVEAGRGSPHGGAYLSFQHVPEAKLREAFGPVIDRLAANGIDLTKMPVEVAPIAHYHMGGVAADVRMQTEVPGLLVAGEAVGGANGANRLSGNAITEALVFGRAGRAHRRGAREGDAAPCRSRPTRRARRVDLHRAATRRRTRPTPPRCCRRLQADHGRRRRAAAHRGQAQARARHASTSSTRALGDRPFGDGGAFDMQRLDWFDLRNMLTSRARSTQAALAAHRKPRRAPARGFPGMLPEWRVNQVDPAATARSSTSRSAPASPVEVGRAMSETATLKIWRGAATRPTAAGKPTRCRSSAASRCSTACAGSASTRTRRSPSASPASTPTPARNA